MEGRAVSTGFAWNSRPRAQMNCMLGRAACIAYQSTHVTVTASRIDGTSRQHHAWHIFGIQTTLQTETIRSGHGKSMASDEPNQMMLHELELI